MGTTSKKYFEEKFKKVIWEELQNELSRAKSEKEVKKALGKALAPAELNLLEKRLAVHYLLRNKLSYRKISEIADVHYNTISFIKKGLKKPVRTKRVYSAFPKKEKRKVLKFPVYKGRGRWRFLDTY